MLMMQAEYLHPETSAEPVKLVSGTLENMVDDVSLIEWLLLDDQQNSGAQD